MKIKLTKNCKLQCWSGRNDEWRRFKKGEEFEGVDLGEYYECESEDLGIVLVEKENCEVI
jgi:hypothetical protein